MYTSLQGDKMNKATLLISILSLGYFNIAQAATLYVKSGAPAGGNGSSWSQAFNDLHSALVAAQNMPGSDQIFIANGTYKPSVKYSGSYTGTESNLVTFKLPSDVAVLGGFKGTESSVLGRICDPSKTILSGDIQGNDINDVNNKNTNKSDNTYHVLTADGAKNVIIDCLTISNGYAGGPDAGSTSGPPQFTLQSIDYSFSAGGGLIARNGAEVKLTKVKLNYNAANSQNATIRSNPALGSPPVASVGGAIAVLDEDTEVNILASAFEHNSCFGFGCNGGAVSALLEASYKVTLSSFNNNAANRNGGAVHGKDAHDINVTASVFKNNIITGSAIGDESGGGIGVINSNLSVLASSFSNGVSSLTAGGGGIFFHSPFDDGEPYVLSVIASSFDNNTAGVVGGGAINISGNNVHPETKATISSSLFLNNTAADGGALYVDSIKTNVSDSSFINNKAGFTGGAIFASSFLDGLLSFGTLNLSERKPLTIKNSLFKNNTITGVLVLPPQFVFNLFAVALSSINSQGQGSVSQMTAGGGAIASVFAGNVIVSNSAFVKNSAPNANGGALLVGGTLGTPAAMNQGYLKISNSQCSENIAGTGDNSSVLDLGNLGNSANGVQLDSDGSCL